MSNNYNTFTEMSLVNQAKVLDLLTETSEKEIERAYNEMLDDCFDVIEIAGMKYNTSRALKDVDPGAYNCGLADYSSEYYIEVQDKNAYNEIKLYQVDLFDDAVEQLLWRLEKEEEGE